MNHLGEQTAHRAPSPHERSGRPSGLHPPARPSWGCPPGAVSHSSSPGSQRGVQPGAVHLLHGTELCSGSAAVSWLFRTYMSRGALQQIVHEIQWQQQHIGLKM